MARIVQCCFTPFASERISRERNHAFVLDGEKLQCFFSFFLVGFLKVLNPASLMPFSLSLVSVKVASAIPSLEASCKHNVKDKVTYILTLFLLSQNLKNHIDCCLCSRNVSSVCPGLLEVGALSDIQCVCVASLGFRMYPGLVLQGTFHVVGAKIQIYQIILAANWKIINKFGSLFLLSTGEHVLYLMWRSRCIVTFNKGT